MNTVIRFSTAAFGLTALAMLTACGTDTPQAQPRTVTATVTASSAPTAAPTEASGDTGGSATDVADGNDAAPRGDAPQQPAPAEPCGPRDLSPATIKAAIAKVPPGGRGYEWLVRDSNYSTCNNISYVELDTVGGTGSSPSQLMIFDRNARFLGTGIKCNAGFQSVIGSSADAITVRYGYPKPGESTASASGRAQVTFRWNGSRVVMDGTLPYDVTGGRC